MFSGVPVGVQIDWLSCNNTGCPPALTLTAPVTHCAVTQGGLPEPESAQPATT